MSTPPCTPPSRSSPIMARITVPYSSPRNSPILPLSHARPSSLSTPASPSTRFSTSTSPRRVVRRFSYNLKNRFTRYSFPLAIGLILTTLIIFFTAPASGTSTISSLRSLASFNKHSKVYSRDPNAQHHLRPGAKQTGKPGSPDTNGISFLTQDPDELIAEDGLYLDAYLEETHQSAAEKAAQEEAEARRQDVVVQNRKDSIRALIWWIAQGGVFPTGWEVPSKSELARMGSIGVEKMLSEITESAKDANKEGSTSTEEAKENEDEQDVFSEGWQEYADARYKVTVFSKSYCPYSKRAKAILRKYQLIPSPYIVELDLRLDTSTIQTLLSHLTSRRTVPNLIFDFESFGGSDELTLIDSEGGLRRKFNAMRPKAVYGAVARPRPVVGAPVVDVANGMVAAPAPVPAPVPIQPAEKDTVEKVVGEGEVLADSEVNAEVAPRKGLTEIVEKNGKPKGPSEKQEEVVDDSSDADTDVDEPTKDRKADVIPDDEEEVEAY